jgi:hypothetical protein
VSNSQAWEALASLTTKLTDCIYEIAPGNEPMVGIDLWKKGFRSLQTFEGGQGHFRLRKRFNVSALLSRKLECLIRRAFAAF